MQTDAPASTSPQSTPTVEATTGSYIFLTVVAGISLAADLITKGWAHARLAGFDPQKLGPKKVEVIKDHLDFIYALNPGGAWSFLRSLPDSLRRPFFLFVSASAIVFIVSIYRRVPPSHKAMRWGLPLALGGAMGNLVDRIRYGQVIDFIDMYITRNGKEIHWPTYNVADIAIVAGVGLMIIDMLIPARRDLAGIPLPATASAELAAAGPIPAGVSTLELAEPSPPAEPQAQMVSASEEVFPAPEYDQEVSDGAVRDEGGGDSGESDAAQEHEELEAEGARNPRA